MMLHRQSREYYSVVINSTRPVTQVHASFDDGNTWTLGELVDGAWRWLIRGPDAPVDPQIPAALVDRSETPLLRITGNPELIVRPALENQINLIGEPR